MDGWHRLRPTLYSTHLTQCDMQCTCRTVVVNIYGIHIGAFTWLCSVITLSWTWLTVLDYIPVCKTWSLRHPLEQLATEASPGFPLCPTSTVQMAKFFFKNVLLTQRSMARKTFQAANFNYPHSILSGDLWEVSSSILLTATRLHCWNSIRSWYLTLNLAFNPITSTSR